MSKNNQIVIINGSARKNGNTSKVLDHLAQPFQFDRIDLIDYVIKHFDYDFNNKDDDFLSLIKRIISSYNTIIMATPIYWYTMSGHMKVFFDRLSDLLKIEKEMGRLLRGKSMAVIANSGANDIKKGLYIPFEASAEYLGMSYIGSVHIAISEEGLDQENRDKLLNFYKNLIKERC